MLKHIKSFTNNRAMRYMKEFNERRNFKSLKMCKKCYTFYYKNSWHIDRPEQLEGDTEPIVFVRFTECPACLEEGLALYDAELLPI